MRGKQRKCATFNQHVAVSTLWMTRCQHEADVMRQLSFLYLLLLYVKKYVLWNDVSVPLPRYSCRVLALGLYPVYTIKQTSNNHQANIQQMHSKYTCTCLLDVCLMFASRRLCFMHVSYLLDVCSIFAWWLFDRVNGVSRFYFMMHVRKASVQCN